MHLTLPSEYFSLQRFEQFFSLNVWTTHLDVGLVGLSRVGKFEVQHPEPLGNASTVDSQQLTAPFAT